MVKLSKAIIKKYGISKKAWAVARGSHSVVRKKTKTRFQTMAKRRTSKRSRSRAKSSGGMGGIVKILIGVAVAVLIQVFAVPLIPIADGMIKSLIVVAVGILLTTMGGMPSFVRAGGAALATLELASIVRGFFGGMGVSSGSAVGSTAPTGMKVYS